MEIVRAPSRKCQRTFDFGCHTDPPHPIRGQFATPSRHLRERSSVRRKDFPILTRIVSLLNEAAVAVRRILPVLLTLSVGISPACGKSGEVSGEGARSSTPQAETRAAKSDEEQSFEMVVSLFEARDFGGAIRNAKDFAASYPESTQLAQVVYLSGRASIMRGDFDDGIAALSDMRQRFPDNENIPFADFYTAQALYLKVHGPVAEYKVSREAALPGYEKALSAFQETAEKYKGDAVIATRSSLMEGQVFQDMGRITKALDIYQAYLNEQPEGEYADKALFQVAEILMDLERWDEAQEAFSRLTREFPGTPHSGTSIDRIRELALIGEAMPSLQSPRWIGATPPPADYRGKVVLVVFWNTWCAHCQQEMPKLEVLYKKLKSRGLIVLGLTSNDQNQNDQSVKQFLEKYGVTFPVGIESGRAANAYAVGRIPAAAIVSRKGIVRWRNSGDLVDEELIERYL